MICPSCGFEQPAAEICSQCQTPLAAAPKTVPLAEPSVGEPRTASRSSADAPVAEPTPVKKAELPSRPEVPDKSPEAAKAPQGASVRLQKEESKPPVPAQGKQAAAKKESLPGVVSPDRQAGAGQERLEQLERMVVTTTLVVVGKQVLAYHGVVTATVLVKEELLKEVLQDTAGEVVGIRSSPLQGAFEKARMVALTDLKMEAAKRGANAVVGLTLSQMSATGGIWLSMVGTAVTLKE